MMKHPVNLEYQIMVYQNNCIKFTEYSNLESLITQKKENSKTTKNL